MRSTRYGHVVRTFKSSDTGGLRETTWYVLCMDRMQAMCLTPKPQSKIKKSSLVGVGYGRPWIDPWHPWL